jgi:hypothetical protein
MLLLFWEKMRCTGFTLPCCRKAYLPVRRTGVTDLANKGILDARSLLPRPLGKKSEDEKRGELIEGSLINRRLNSITENL